MIYNPYSVSKFGTFNHCPKQFEYKYIKKIKVPFTMNVALYKGSHIHKILEHNFDYKTEFKTNDIYTEKHFNETLEIVKTFENSELGQKYKKIIPNAHLEEDFAFNSKMELVSYWDKQAWIRGSADAYFTNGNKGNIFDYKSGKSHKDEEDFGITQSMAYAIYMFIKFPEVNDVKAIFCFVEHSEEKEIEYTRDKLPEYMRYFYDMTKNVETKEIFEERTSTLCGWCDYEQHGICTKRADEEKSTDSFMNTKIDFM